MRTATDEYAEHILTLSKALRELRSHDSQGLNATRDPVTATVLEDTIKQDIMRYRQSKGYNTNGH